MAEFNKEKVRKKQSQFSRESQNRLEESTSDSKWELVANDYFTLMILSTAEVCLEFG